MHESNRSQDRVIDWGWQLADEFDLLKYLKPIPCYRSTIMNHLKLLRLFIAGLFFLFWSAILYAGADHPPPPQFLFLILLVLGCAALVYWRTKAYISWAASKKKNRFLRVIFDGFAAGLAIVILMTLLPFSGEASIPDPGIVENLIWGIVLSMLGVLNSVAVYGIVSLYLKYGKVLSQRTPKNSQDRRG